jgi:hypothetical protein
MWGGITNISSRYAWRKPTAFTLALCQQTQWRGQYPAIMVVSLLHNSYSAMRREKETAHHGIAYETEVWDFYGPVSSLG